jgi:hypothetical protein
MEFPEWAHWKTAAAPATIEAANWYRDFHPIMRSSQRSVRAYVNETLSTDWRGHHEFTIPTAAIHRAMRVADITQGGFNYTNTPRDPDPAPGSLIYRPIRTFDFHERPDTFDQPDLLYHPVKPD